MRIVLALALLMNFYISGCGGGGRLSERTELRINHPESGGYEVTWKINQNAAFQEILNHASCDPDDGICALSFKLDDWIASELVKLGESIRLSAKPAPQELLVFETPQRSVSSGKF